MRDRRPSSSVLLTVVVVLAALILVRRFDFIDLPDWLDGGKSDPAPKGTVIYKGQTARSASENFLIDIGNGSATVAVKAKQDHDKPGNIFSGDFQSTNGTSSVADPDDRGQPAQLTVKVDYCADGTITTFEQLEETDQGEARVGRQIRFDLGHLYVCNTTLEHTVANDSAFKQDDTPTDFHGKFVSFVAGAAETTAAAAACPKEELERFSDPEIVDYMQERLADQYGVPRQNVEVVAGTPGESSDGAKRRLRDKLESYANMQDPEHPDRDFEALSIEYLSTDRSAVDDSCFKSPGGTSLETLERVHAPDPSPER